MRCECIACIAASVCLASQSSNEGKSLFMAITLVPLGTDGVCTLLCDGRNGEKTDLSR